MKIKELIIKGKNDHKPFPYLIEIYMKDMRKEEDFDRRNYYEGIIYGIIIGLENADYLTKSDAEAIINELSEFAEECCKNSMRI